MSGWPRALRVSALAAMLNFEFADDPVYSGIELQWFDDDEHGTGMLAFLTRRDTDRVDYCRQPGLRLDPSAWRIGGGVGVWNETPFDDAVLTVAGDGVRAAATFTDADGRANRHRRLRQLRSSYRQPVTSPARPASSSGVAANEQHSRDR